MCGRPVTPYMKGYAWKFYGVMDWDLYYSGFCSGTGTDRRWFQRQGSFMDVPSAQEYE